MSTFEKLEALYQEMKNIDPETIENPTIDLGFDYHNGNGLISATDELFVKYMKARTISKFEANKVVIFDEVFERVKKELREEAVTRLASSQSIASSSQAIIDEIDQV